jgi:hypothetical protein
VLVLLSIRILARLRSAHLSQRGYRV